MSSFILKLIAILTMFIDHLRYVIPTQPFFMSYIGRLAFPLFAFQIVEGYHHTKNLKKYFIKLGSFAIISQVPFMLFTNSTDLNVLFTFVLGLCVLYIYDNLKGNLTINILKYISIILICVVAEAAQTDYGAFGLVIMLFFHIFREHKLKITISFLICTFIYFNLKYNLINNLTYIRPVMLYIFTSFAIIPILLYNGKLGNNRLQHFFYWFYPVHLLMLYLVGLII